MAKRARNSRFGRRDGIAGVNDHGNAAGLQGDAGRTASRECRRACHRFSVWPAAPGTSLRKSLRAASAHCLSPTACIFRAVPTAKRPRRSPSPSPFSRTPRPTLNPPRNAPPRRQRALPQPPPRASSVRLPPQNTHVAIPLPARSQELRVQHSPRASSVRPQPQNARVAVPPPARSQELRVQHPTRQGHPPPRQRALPRPPPRASSVRLPPQNTRVAIPPRTHSQKLRVFLRASASPRGDTPPPLKRNVD